jgi:acyl-CoA thioester hydrolase
VTTHFSPAPESPFELRERVRWSHCDPMGIIWYGTYLRFIEAAEQEMFRACGLPYTEVRIARGLMFPRKALSLEFHSPAQLDEEIVIQAWFSKIGTTSFAMRFEVLRESDRARRASALLTVVHVDKATMKPHALPDDVKELMRRYTA